MTSRSLMNELLNCYFKAFGSFMVFSYLLSLIHALSSFQESGKISAWFLVFWLAYLHDFNANTDRKSEIINQEKKTRLRFFVCYEKDDWSKKRVIARFETNNHNSCCIKLSLIFAAQDAHIQLWALIYFIFLKPQPASGLIRKKQKIFHKLCSQYKNTHGIIDKNTNQSVKSSQLT